jgi:single-stranded DNA-binding protein
MSERKVSVINQVALTGYLAEEPEFRYAESKDARLRARLLVSRPYRDDKGNWQEDTSFFENTPSD